MKLTIKDKWKRKLKYFFYFCLFGISLVLLFLPKDYFDTGQSMCVSVVLLNKQCYACGMTRAIQHLIHFDFLKAYYFNKISFIVFPLLVFMIVTDFIKFVKNK